ncbi:MAG: hypothetical protein MI862_28425 [Desulfobacterales bacterium]|nr:hypothetical protein [Desulfobacterales bacterium]
MAVSSRMDLRYGESDCIEMDKVSDFNTMLDRVMSQLDIWHADLVGISAGASYAYAAAGAWTEKIGTFYILGECFRLFT